MMTSKAKTNFTDDITPIEIALSPTHFYRPHTFTPLQVSFDSDMLLTEAKYNIQLEPSN